MCPGFPQLFQITLKYFQAEAFHRATTTVTENVDYMKTVY